MKNSSQCVTHDLLKNPINDENETGMVHTILQGSMSGVAKCVMGEKWNFQIHLNVVCNTMLFMAHNA